MENQRGDSLRMRKERNLEAIFGVGFTFPLPVGKSIVYGETDILYNFFCALDFLFTVLKRYMEGTDQKKAAVGKREGLPCIALLLTTVEETPQVVSAQVRGHFPKWLSGSLLRIGPGKFEFGKDK